MIDAECEILSIFVLTRVSVITFVESKCESDFCSLTVFVSCLRSIMHWALAVRNVLTYHFYAIRDRKELYTSKESPIACRLKAILKLEEYLS